MGRDKTHTPLEELKKSISIEEYNLRLPRGGFNLHILVSYAGFTSLLSLLIQWQNMYLQQQLKQLKVVL